MDAATLIQLDKDMLLALNGSDNLFVDSIATTLTAAVTWVPLYVALFYVVLRNNESMKSIVFILLGAACCVALSGTLNDLFVKPNVARPRPSHDMQIGLLVDVVGGYRGGAYGFFSSHAANTFSIAVFIGLLMRSKALGIALVLWSLVNGWTRVYLGVHYPGDVLCGLLWGACAGSVVYWLYYRFSGTERRGVRYVSSEYTSTGYLCTDIDIVLCVLAATLAYAAVRACLMI